MTDEFPSRRRASSASSRNGNGNGPAHHQANVGGSEPVLVSVDMARIIGILRQRKWIVIGIAAATVAGVAYLVQTARPTYGANAVIRLVDTRRVLAGGLVGQQATDVVSERTADPVRSQIQVLLSRAVAGSVVDSSDALGARAFAREFPDSVLRDVRVAPDTPVDSVQLRFMPRAMEAHAWISQFADTAATDLADTSATPEPPVLERSVAYGSPVDLHGVSFTVQYPPGVMSGALVVISRDQAIDNLLGNLTAKPRVDTDVIDVSYTAHDARLAQEITNTVVEVFRAINAQTAFQQARRRRAFVEEQLRQNDSLLADANNALGAVRSVRERAARPLERSAGEIAALTSLETRREEMNADRLLYESLLNNLRRARTERDRASIHAIVSSPELAQNPVIGQLYSQMVGYQTARDSLTTGTWASANTHPDVRRLDTLLTATEEKLADALNSLIGALEARIAVLDGIKAQNPSQSQSLSEPEQEEARLAQQVLALEKSAEIVRQEYQEARIAAAAEVGQVEIVDLASLPTKPLGMPPARKIAIGVMLGLLLGAAGALFVEYIDGLRSSIRRRREIENLLAIPMLGLVPAITNGSGNGRRLHLPWGNGSNNTRAAAARSRTALVSVVDLRSPGAEAYRTLRTNLLFSQAVHTFKTIAVTSATPSEGKTTTAVNLAITFAQQELKVLLVDCDLRRPQVHGVFDIPREPGLTQMLLGQSADGAIRPGPVAGLSVLPAGQLPPNPSELLGGTRMRNLLDSLYADFDVIVLDSPPVLVAPDAAVIGAMVNGVILVVRAGRTDRADAQEALLQLNNVDAKVLGAVLNDPDSKVPANDTRYRYGYYATAE